MLIFENVSRFLIIFFFSKECDLYMKSQCKWRNSIFSVGMKLLLPASGNPSLSNSSQSILGFIRENLSAVFARGFHMDSIIPSLHPCCGYGGDVFQSCWGQKWLNFCHPRYVGIAGVKTWVCWCLSHGLTKSPVLVLSHSRRDFCETVLFKFYLLVYYSALCPILAQVQMGLADWHHAK